MPQSESGRDSGEQKRSSEHRYTRKHSYSKGGPLLGCGNCGRLLLSFGKGGLEVKCVRCKRIQLVTWLELDRRREELRG